MIPCARRPSAVGLLVLAAGTLAGCGASDSMESTGSVALGVTTTETVALIASADTTVRLVAPNQNFGLSARLDVNRALVRFDQAALSGAIGASDRLLGAELEFTVTASAKRLLPRPVGAFRLTTAWTETGATWFCPSDTHTGNSRPDCAKRWSLLAPEPNPWASPATDTVVLPSRPGVIRFDVTADVQAFLAGTAPNHGWMLRPELPTLFAELGSRESTTPPRLLVSVKRCNPTLCNDDNVCTVDACDATASCTNEPIAAGTSCGDELVCDGAGACVGVPRVVVNEAESSGGVPGDWVELFNAGTGTADVSGWRFLDGDDTHVAYVIPAGTSIAPGAFLVLDEAQFGFGLGGADNVRLFDASGTLVDSYAWTAHAPTTYGRCPDGTGAFATTTSVTKGTANDCSVAVRLNEVESSGGVPGDWVELYNAGPTAVDVSGWRFLDNDDTHVASVIPAGTSIAPGGFYVLEEVAIGFGLGGADSARLYDAAGTLLETYAWTAHATTTYGRCPDGSGAFTTTVSASKGAANVCSGGPPPVAAWPGANSVITVDGVSTFGGNLSDLYYEGGSPSALWAVRNGPSTLFRLVFDGAIWTPDTLDGWSAGKTLLYPGSVGAPDTEGVTRAELDSSAMYVATERDNDSSGVSRLSILRFDTADSGTSLSATHEWNLNADLPVVGANLGLEAITWIPDSTLVVSSFFDEATGLPYDPASYPNHGTGLFFVGIEANGMIYAYALDHVAGGFTRVATIASGNPGVMAVSFDREVGYLWAHCDDTCGNVAGVLAIDTTPGSPTFGRFTLIDQLARPSTMPNINNEGIAFAPESECSSGFKRYFWTDDSETGGHSIRADSIPCGAFLP